MQRQTRHSVKSRRPASVFPSIAQLCSASPSIPKPGRDKYSRRTCSAVNLRFGLGGFGTRAPYRYTCERDNRILAADKRCRQTPRRADLASMAMADNTGRAADAQDRPDLVHSWLTAEGAAMTLGVSLRTVHRRIKSGELESRVNNLGRREVLVCQPTPPADTADACLSPTDRHDRPAEAWQTQNGGQMADAAGDPGNAIAVADSGALRSIQLSLSDIVHSHAAHARRARRAARLGWFVAGVLGLALAATLALAQRWRADDMAQAQIAQQRAAGAEFRAAQAAHERDRAMIEMGRALQQVDAQTAAAQLPATRPSVKPSGWVVKLASVFDQ